MEEPSETPDRQAGASRPAAAAEAEAVAERVVRMVERAGDDPVGASDCHPGVAEERDALALEIIRLQARALPAYRRLFAARGVDPETLADWRDAPAVPTAAFQTVELSIAEPRVIFRSSGTTRGAARRSIHRQPFPDLYRRIVDSSFPGRCLPRPRAEATPMLALVPRSAIAPDSSLSFMVELVVERYGDPGISAWCLGQGGLDRRASIAWFERATHYDRPVLVLSTALALAELLRVVQTTGRSFELPAGSVVFETGGFKGRERHASRADLIAGCRRWLGLPERQVVREYGMTELTSQAYTRALDGGDPDRFFCPPWLVPQVLDPGSLDALPAGETGLLRFLDLGNVGSAALVLTEDLGRLDPDGGFHLVGRAAGAALRGCSLAAEELLAGT